MDSVVRQSQRDLLVEVAILRYRLDLTQVEIAKRLNVSPMQVSRLLDKARRLGIVRIEIDTGISTDAVLENALKKRYGLKEAIVVKTASAVDPIDELVRAAAMHVDMLVSSDSVIGITGGRTVMRMIPLLKLPALHKEHDVKVVQLSGGLMSTSLSNPVVSLNELALRFDAKGYYLNIPLYVSANQMESYLAMQEFQKIRDLWKQCTVCFGSVGPVGKDCIYYRDGTINDEQMNEALAKGAVGNVYGRWIDAQGEYIDCELNKMVVSIPHEILREIPQRVFVLGDENRIPGAKAVMKKGLFNICVVTDVIAQSLI